MILGLLEFQLEAESWFEDLFVYLFTKLKTNLTFSHSKAAQTCGSPSTKSTVSVQRTNNRK